MENDALERIETESEQPGTLQISPDGKIGVSGSHSSNNVGLFDIQNNIFLGSVGVGNRNNGFFDRDALSFPLVLRNFRHGDRFTPLGMTGTQKIKKFFIDKKVPRKKRARCPILLCRGKTIWVVGYRIDESVKVKASTKNVLKVELSLA